MNTTHKEQTWVLKTKFSNLVLSDFDFTDTNMNSAIFERVTFNSSLFERTNVDNTRLFHDCNFDHCIFKNVKLKNSAFGNNKGEYNNCQFEKCDFTGLHFNATRFINCGFTHCKLKNINFNASSFLQCQFVGKLENVTFNGIYDTNTSTHKILENVDFSAAIFGEFVSFFDCDLSTCTPPQGKTFEELLYIFDLNSPANLSSGSKDRIVIPLKL
ncbi:pentapeptide repeat-containing protein [Chitinophaga sp.]|uniref:pentapeptide repeat-containing protein n=1 Tax=Chitinophaga sp. TaxID=1869181 RepID=UPI002F95D71C